MEQIRKYTTPNVQVIIVGNKSDLDSIVSDEEAQEIAKRWEIEYFTTSAKYFDDSNLVFNAITRKVYGAAFGVENDRALKILPQQYKKNQFAD